VIIAAQAAILISLPQTASAYAFHTPIVITSDSGFNSSNGVTGGSGLPGDPYIIEGWEINTSASYGISIQNTNAYFVIRGVYVHGGYWSGIYMYMVSGGRVENSTISDNDYGLYLSSVTNTTIADNLITGNSCGIEAGGSINVTIEGNVVTSNFGLGVFVHSDYSVIRNNNVTWNGGEGLYLDGAAWLTVEGNEVANNYDGIVLEHRINNCTLSHNRIISNRVGIRYDNDSRMISLIYNLIRQNTQDGLEIRGGIENLVAYNEISYNAGYGVRIMDPFNSTNFLIHHNNFIGNSVPQAYDYTGMYDRWHDGCSVGGNYWSDYSGSDGFDCVSGMAGSDGYGDTPYVIDSDSQDNYPFMQPLDLSFNNTPPTVTVTSPNGGETWTGGSVYNITWSMYDDFDSDLSVWIQYSIDAGSSWEDIPGAQNISLPVGNQTFPWTVPYVNTDYAQVKVEVMDSSGATATDYSDDFFTIFTDAPFIVATNPTDGEIDVPVTAPIVITFSESMNTSSVTVSVVPTHPFTHNWSAGDTVLTLNHATPFMDCTMYTVFVYGQDWNGDNLVPGPVPNPFSFAVGCGAQFTVTLLNPVGGEDWTGGHFKTLAWNVTDQGGPIFNVTIDLYYSVNGGSSWTDIALNISGSNVTYPWLVPILDSSSAKVRACATKPNNNTVCGSSGLLTIDSTSPQILQTSPANGEIDVPVDTFIRFYWSEVMNVAYGYISMTPTIAGNASWNMSGTMFQFAPISLLQQCTQYWFTLIDFRDDSDPGNNMSSGYTLNFTTKCPGPPSVALTSPVGGEYLKGGSSFSITWTANDAETPNNQLIFIINYTSSASSGLVIGPVQGISSYLWTVPAIDATDVIINITAIDGDGMKGWDESGPFTIDSTPPSLSSHAPTGWNVPVIASVDAFFDEPVSAMLNFTKESFGLQEVATLRWGSVTWHRVPSGSLFLQEFHFVPDSPLEECAAYMAHINGTFFDRALWYLTNPTSWTFHTVCPPSMSLQTLLGGKDWTGGSKHDVVWSMSDEIDTQLRVWMNYSKDGGLDGYPYSAYTGVRATGVITYMWTVPLIDTASAKVRVTVMDSSGLKAVAESSAFQIDSTPPSILTSVPGAGSLGVKITDSIQVVFTEAIVRSTAEQAFSISPDPGGVSFSWQRLGLGNDMLVVSHKPLSSKTDYVITFSTAIKDVSDSGNHPTAALTLHFSTKPPPNVNPPVAKAVGKNQILVSEQTTFDGSQSTGDIGSYVWTITDNQNNIVDVLVGMIVNYTFTHNGRYKVTLVVTDVNNGLPGIDSLEIVVTSNDNAGALILLSSALLMGALLGGTEIGRMSLFMLVAVPVYKRKNKGKEDPETRGMIKGYILVHPGDTYTDIKRNLSLNDGALTWHLMKLEKASLIKSMIRGSRRLYFPANMPLPFEDGGDLHEIEKRMLHMVKTDPGMTVKVLAEELGVSSQLALYHMRKLSQRGLVSLERRGLRLKAYPPSKRAT
jgi:parallel beta-helix repeat protein